MQDSDGHTPLLQRDAAAEEASSSGGSGGSGAAQSQRHRRCRSMGAAAYYGSALALMPSAGVRRAPSEALPADGMLQSNAEPLPPQQQPCGEQPLQPQAQPPVQSGQQQQQQQQQEQQQEQVPPPLQQFEVAQGAQHLQPCSSSACGHVAGWQATLNPSRAFQRPGGRHRRSASVGIPSGHAGGIGAWWTGPVGGGGPLPTALPGGGAAVTATTSAAGLLAGLGGLVAESLGARRPSFCLDPVALARSASSRAPSRAASSAGCLLPTCLICLDALSPEDFASGEAITQRCACKGDVALRHRRCAVQWARVKRSTVCDVCRAPIANLPELTSLTDPLAAAAAGVGEAINGGAVGTPAADPLALGEPLGVREYLMDAVRVAWCALVLVTVTGAVPASQAFLIGAVVGVVLTAVAHAIAVAQRSAAAVRAFAHALRERASLRRQHLQRQRQQQQPPPLPLQAVAANHNAEVVGAAGRAPSALGRGAHSRTPSSTVLLVRED